MADIFDLIGDSFDVSFSESSATTIGGGVSPTVEVSEIDGGHRVSFTDAEKTVAFDVLDGMSPTVKVTAISGGHRVTVTDINGETSFDVLNGTTSGVPDTETEGDGGGTGTVTARGIESFERTSGDGSAGSTDVYTITYTDGTASQFSVYNGRNGKDGVDGIDGADGLDGKNGTDATVTKAAVEAVLTGNVTTHTHSQYVTSHQDVSGKLDKSGGTMTGILKAYNNTGYSTMQVRNIAVIANGATAPTGANGDIYFTYI